MVEIKHLSLAVKNPKRVARLLAEMTAGKAQPFSSGTAMKAWICLWNAEKNELIEFLPLGWTMAPTDRGATFKKTEFNQVYNPTHVQLEVKAALDHLQSIANKYGCKHNPRPDPKRGGPLYEVWLEDDFLVEFTSDEIRAMNS